MRMHVAVGGAVSACLLLGGCSGAPPNTSARGVASATPVAVSPSPTDGPGTPTDRLGSRSGALPPFVASTRSATALANFLKSRPGGLPPISATRGTADDGCTVVGVKGADLDAGALDVYIGVPGGDCGGDAAGTLYEIRHKRVVASGSACGDCEGPDAADASYNRLAALYENRASSNFTVVADELLGSWRLVPRDTGPTVPKSTALDCGQVRSPIGTELAVVNVNGSQSCTYAVGLLKRYYEPSTEQTGSGLYWTSPDGWDCFSPSAGEYETTGVASRCTKYSGPGVIEARRP